nr:hypothetical protein [Nitrosomonas sp.]
MNTQQSRFKRVAIFLISISAVSIPAISHADWSIKALDSLGGDILDVNAINDRGQIVGYSYFTPIHNNYHAFITGPDGRGMTDLGALGGSNYSVATAINESGQVTGHTTIDSFSVVPFAFITGPDGVGMTSHSPDLFNSIGTDINDSGQVVGVKGDTSSFSMRMGPNGFELDFIPAVSGLSGDRATAINNSGQVVGYYLNRDSNYQAFITNPDGTAMTELGTLGGKESRAFDINESGQVIGFSDATNGNFYNAFVTGPNGAGMTNLGAFGGRFSIATGMN